ncbi:MAG: glycoside hydrolase family 16 protein [Deltaproteobacteria bacterium]|nr:glycoside hydrolase family 16 protein [Deltaproteobacteria bacterium]
MKKLFVVLVSSCFLGFACSNSAGDHHKNYFEWDSLDTGNNIQDFKGLDVVIEDIFLITDFVSSPDVKDIFVGTDHYEEQDIGGDGYLPDEFFDDFIFSEIDVYDIGGEYAIAENLTDIVAISDIGYFLSPPSLMLMTDSPSLETVVRIGGNALEGKYIHFFKNKSCSGRSFLVKTTSDFNKNGVEVVVDVGSTNYFSAYVSDGMVYSNCSNFITYVHHNNAYWYVSFFDDFKGIQDGEDPECYLMPPQCIGEYQTGLYECPQSESHSGLKALNKCKWTILRQPNWMANEYGPDKNGTNGFTPLEVSVEPNIDNGILILSANAYKWDGTKLNASSLTTSEKNCLSQPQANWLLHENNSPDCRNIVTYNCVWSKNTINCPIMSGAVYSKRFGSYRIGNTDVRRDRGFVQEYGRWEVRAMIPSGVGSFPAHWLLPQSGSWPERGEIDIMESDRYARQIYQTYHTGYCEGSSQPYYPDHQECLRNGGQRYHLSIGGRLVYKNDSFASAYHVYAVEWDKERINFYTDNVLLLSVKNGDMNYGVFTDNYRHTGQARPLNIPFGEFFIILNQTVHNDNYGYIEPLNFVRQTHKIDYVKVFDVCSSPTNFCGEGFYFDGGDGFCYPVDANQNKKPYRSPCRLKEEIIPKPQEIDTKYFYGCTNPCPFGGWFDGSNCHIFTSPKGREVFFWPDERGNLYYVTDGSLDGNCYETINGITYPVGKFDGANCFLDKTLNALHGRYFRWGNPKPTAFYYQPFCRFD